MQNLRGLICSGWMLHHTAALQHFGQLSLLEEVALVSDDLPESLPAPNPHYLALSEESFLALPHLEIRNLSPSMISYLCNLRPLVRHLTRLSVIYSFSYDDPSDDDVSDEERTHNVILPLDSTSLQLTDLKLATRGNYGLVHITGSVLEVLKKLNLLHLDVGSIDLGPEIRWGNFADALSHLQELDIRWQMLEFQRLEVFAHAFPNLRLLALRSLLFGLLNQNHPMSNYKPGVRHIQLIIVRATFRAADGLRNIEKIAERVFSSSGILHTHL